MVPSSKRTAQKWPKVLTLLYNCLHNLLILQNGNSIPFQQRLPTSPSLQALGTTILLFASMNLTILDTTTIQSFVTGSLHLA